MSTKGVGCLLRGLRSTKGWESTKGVGCLLRGWRVGAWVY